VYKFNTNIKKGQSPLTALLGINLFYKSGAITKLTIAITLIKMFIAGPEVSLNGSPTVSPTTVAE